MSSIIRRPEGKPWGKITWYFIHTFCERIHSDFFAANREKCLAILTSVCHMIPCPLCRTHATEYMKRNPLNRLVKNKEDLKAYFHHFHNQATLNGNPKAPIADASVLEMYSRANFPLIINAFKAEYLKKTPTRLDYAHTMYAQRILKDVVGFIHANQRWFVPTPTPAPTPTPDSINITMNIVE